MVHRRNERECRYPPRRVVESSRSTPMSSSRNAVVRRPSRACQRARGRTHGCYTRHHVPYVLWRWCREMTGRRERTVKMVCVTPVAETRLDSASTAPAWWQAYRPGIRRKYVRNTLDTRCRPSPERAKCLACLALSARSMRARSRRRYRTARRGRQPGGDGGLLAL